jgi:hypothetical protein
MEYICPYYKLGYGEGEDDDDAPTCILERLEPARCNEGDIASCVYKTDPKVIQAVKKIEELRIKEVPVIEDI